MNVFDVVRTISDDGSASPLGYYDCAIEIAEQTQKMGLKDPLLITTVGSMGTYGGLAAAIANEDLPLRLKGIGVLPYRDIRRSAKKFYDRMRDAYDLTAEMDVPDFDMTSEYDCGAYNNPVEEVRRAIYYMGRMEGIILDPCYTGKTFNGILKMLEKGRSLPGAPS